MWLLIGHEKQRSVIECRDKSTLVIELKHKIMNDKGIPVDDMCLKVKNVYGWVAMVDGCLVTDYIPDGVQGASEYIQLTLRLCGKGTGGEVKTKVKTRSVFIRAQEDQSTVHCGFELWAGLENKD